LRGVELSATYAQGPVTAWANLAVSRGRGRSIIGGAALFAPATLLVTARWTPLTEDRPIVGSAGQTWRLGEISLSADMLASSGIVRSAGPGMPDGERG